MRWSVNWINWFKPNLLYQLTKPGSQRITGLLLFEVGFIAFSYGLD
jgi:hypothetical protein